jgi:general secretion pathway protein D
MKSVMTLGAIALLALPALVAAQESSIPMASKASRQSGMELGEVIERFAKRSGKKVIIDPRVRAVVEVEGIDLNQLGWDQLLAILDVHQFVAIDQDGLISVLPDANSRQLSTPVFTDVNFKASDHELATLLIDVKNACAAQIVPVLRPLMPQAAHMAAYPPGNTLILNDRAANLRRIAQLVERLDRMAPAGRKCEDMPAPKPKD